MEQLIEVKDINISTSYADVLKNLTFREINGVREFYGGPLLLGTECCDWVSPVELQDEYGKQQFHIIYLNTHPTNDNSTIPVTLLRLDEMSLKLASKNNRGINILNSLLSNSAPRIIIRPTTTGMIYYPSVSIPSEADEEHIYERTCKTLASLSLGSIDDVIDLRIGNDPTVSVPMSDGVVFVGTKKYESPFGELNVSNFLVENDFWRFYQVISGLPIQDLHSEHAVSMRLDSGCDIGQIYLDRGCDCREQLHDVLGKTVNEGGIIIHLPTQDGRGYGMATKMETEGLKRGIRVMTNEDNLAPMKTIDAARFLLGDNFDIRTYMGVGRIVKSLGIKSVKLYTNNRMKVQGLTQMGIGVNRESAKTNNSNGCGDQVESKLAYSPIYISE